MYMLFKVARLGEQDLDDCMALLAWCNDHDEVVDRVRVKRALSSLAETPDEGLVERRQQLADALDS